MTVNLLGLPAVTVPAGQHDGPPTGVQIIGPRFREDLCLDAAAAVEAGAGSLTPIDPRTQLAARRRQSSGIRTRNSQALITPPTRPASTAGIIQYRPPPALSRK